MQKPFDFFRDTLQLEDSQQPLTRYAGLMLPQQVLDDTGLADETDDRLPAATSNHCYTAGRAFSVIVLLQMAGGETLADIRKFRHDGLFRGRALPTDRCRAGWLAHFGTPEGMAALRQLQRSRLRRTVSPGEYALDLDCTQLRTTKAGAQRAYNGETGFYLATGFLEGADGMVWVEMRPGNLSQPGAERTVRALESSLEILPDGVSVGMVRGDNADYLGAFFAAAARRDLPVVVKAQRTPAVLAGASKVAPEAWLPSRRRGRTATSGSWSIASATRGRRAG